MRYRLRTRPRWLRPLLAVLGWGVSTSAIILAAIFQGFLLPKLSGPFAVGEQPFEVTYYYLGLLGVSILATLVMEDDGLSVLGFFISYVVGLVITYSVMSLPAFLGTTPLPDLVASLALTATFFAFFPIAFFVGLFGTFIGIGLGSSIR